MNETASEDPAQAPPPHNERALIALFLLVALAVRGAHFLALRDLEFFQVLGLDAQYYHDWATRIADGRGSPDTAFFLGPLYPYTLGSLYRIFGSSITVAQAAQLGLGALATPLVYATARRAFDRSIAIWAAILFTGYGFLIFLELHLVTAGLLTFLSAALLYVMAGLDSPRLWRWALAGGLLGMLILGRGVFLVAFVVAAAVAVVTAGAGHGRVVRRLGTVAAGVVLVVLPVSVRNLKVGGEFVLVTTNGGINYAIGNNPGADGLFEPMSGVSFFQPESGADGGSRRLAEQRSGRALSPAQASTYWLKEGLTWNLNNPGRTVTLWGKKALMAVSDYEIPQIENFGWARDESALLRWNPIRFGILSALGLLGMAWALATRRAGARLLALALGSYLVALLPFFITARYRVVVTPILVIFAAFALVSLWRGLRASDGGTLARAGSGLVALLLLVHAYRPPGIEAASDQLLAYNRGVVAMQSEDWPTAVRQFTISARDNPSHVPSLANLAFALHETGRTDDAIRVFGAARDLQPDDANILVPFAEILFHANRLEEAERVMLSLLRLNPTDPYTLAQLGEVTYQQARVEDSLNYWNQVLQTTDRTELRTHAQSRIDELRGN